MGRSSDSKTLRPVGLSENPFRSDNLLTPHTKTQPVYLRQRGGLGKQDSSLDLD